MRKVLFLGVLLAFTILSSSVFAMQSLCVDGNTSQTTGTITINGADTNISYFDLCSFECNNSTGQCNIIDPMPSAILGIALLFVAALFIIVAIKASAGFVFRGLNIEFLQPLFITFSFMMILASFTIMISGSKGSAPIYSLLGSAYNTTMWVFIFFISFLVLSFIVNILQNRLNKAAGFGKRGKQ